VRFDDAAADVINDYRDGKRALKDIEASGAEAQ
jgi:hypothetical protein